MSGVIWESEGCLYWLNPNKGTVRIWQNSESLNLVWNNDGHFAVRDSDTGCFEIRSLNHLEVSIAMYGSEPAAVLNGDPEIHESNEETVSARLRTPDGSEVGTPNGSERRISLQASFDGGETWVPTIEREADFSDNLSKQIADGNIEIARESVPVEEVIAKIEEHLKE